MPDKDRERYYLSRLRECIANLPMGNAQEPEPPDFLFSSGNRRIGIELTSFFYPPNPNGRPQQEIQSLRDRITMLANQLHVSAGGPALYLTAIFNEHYPLRKQDTQRIAEDLSSAVLLSEVPLSVQGLSLILNPNNLPQEIPEVRVEGSVDGIERFWHVDSGGWVAVINSDQVQVEIDRKTQMAPRARQLCNELWLVIVNDLTDKGAPAELSDEASMHPYAHEFDRLLWFDAHIPRAIDLAGCSAAQQTTTSSII